jgi:hypothetical protein
MRSLRVELANHAKATAAAQSARKRLNAAMVRAVKNGNKRYDVAEVVGCSSTHINQIPGMPPGKNAKPRPTTTA